MRARYAAVLTALLFVGFGCGAQPPAAVVEPGNKVSRNGCTVDPKQICQICLRKLDQREIALYANGVIKRDTHRLDQSERHLTILTDYRYPNGDPLPLVNCRFDMRTHTVTRADLTNGRTPADDRAEGTSAFRGCAYKDARR